MFAGGISSNARSKVARSSEVKPGGSGSMNKVIGTGRFCSGHSATNGVWPATRLLLLILLRTAYSKVYRGGMPPSTDKQCPEACRALEMGRRPAFVPPLPVPQLPTGSNPCYLQLPLPTVHPLQGRRLQKHYRTSRTSITMFGSPIGYIYYCSSLPRHTSKSMLLIAMLRVFSSSLQSRMLPWETDLSLLSTCLWPYLSRSHAVPT